MEDGDGPGVDWRCEGEGSGSPDPVQVDLGGFRRPMQLQRLVPTHWSWWILRLINAIGKGIFVFQVLGLELMLFLPDLVFFMFLLLYPNCCTV